MIKNLENMLKHFQNYVQSKENLELYISVSLFNYAECTENKIDFQYQENIGMSVRIFHKSHTDFLYTNGISVEKLQMMLKNNHVMSQLPPTSMPLASTENINPLSKIILDQPSILKRNEIDVDFCENAWDNAKTFLSSKNQQLLKMHIQSQQDIYFIFNSNGVNGYSKRSMSAYGFEINSNQNYLYKIFPGLKLLDNNSYSSLFKMQDRMKDKLTNKRVDYILFSGDAMAKILYFFVFLLNRDLVISGSSIFKIDDLGKKLFSKNLNIEENSSDNKIIIGNVDGEGVQRKAKFIVENGVLNHFFNDSQVSEKIESTASAFRFTHTEPPRIQPTKVSVKGNKSLDWIIKSHNNIIVIDDLTGITESLNPITTDFTAHSKSLYYEKGYPVGYLTVNTNASILQLLNQIIYISNEAYYGADGTILASPFLIENDGFVKEVRD